MRAVIFSLGLVLYIVGALVFAFSGAVLGGVIAETFGAAPATELTWVVIGALAGLGVGLAARSLGPERYVSTPYLRERRSRA